MKKSQAIIDFSLPAAAEWIKIPRVVTSVITERMTFHKDEAEGICLAIAEACANTIRHAYNKNKKGKVRIKFYIYPNKLVIFIMDKGKGFIFSRGTLRFLDKKFRLRESGRGIAIIKGTMDKYKFKSTPNKGTVLRMVKYKR